MHCFTHPETSAVATCGECGRGTCRDCAELLDGRPFCVDCAARARQTLAARRIERGRRATTNAEGIILWSWLCDIASVPPELTVPTLVGAALVGLAVTYVVWSWTWALGAILPAFWRLLRRMPVVVFLTFYVWFWVFVALAVAALVYGVLGGGWYLAHRLRQVREHEVVAEDSVRRRHRVAPAGWPPTPP